MLNTTRRLDYLIGRYGVICSPQAEVYRTISENVPNTMNDFIAHVLANPFMDSVLVICFTLSMLGFWKRVKKENSAEYEKPKPYKDEPKA